MVLDTNEHNFGCQQWFGLILGSLWHFITKCYRHYYKMRQLLYYKMRLKFITKCVRFSITKCDSFIIKCDEFITKCDGYYEMQRLLQKTSVQPWRKEKSTYKKPMSNTPKHIIHKKDPMNYICKVSLINIIYYYLNDLEKFLFKSFVFKQEVNCSIQNICITRLV